jgi:dienelactone hydrolase
MSIRIVCSWCQRSFAVPNNAAGTKVQCPECDEPVKVRVPSHPDHDPLKKSKRRERRASRQERRQQKSLNPPVHVAPALTEHQKVLAPSLPTPPTYLSLSFQGQIPPVTEDVRIPGGPTPLVLALLTIATIAICLALGFGTLALIRMRPEVKNETSAAVSGEKLVNQNRRFPQFPDMLPEGEVTNRGVDIFKVDLGAFSGFPHDMPGGTTQMRIFMPAIDEDQHHPRGSLACVLVPAGGKNPFHGYSLLPPNELEPLFPYSAKGFVVVHFSVDGALPRENYTNQSRFWDDFQTSHRAFKKSNSGVENAVMAYEFVRQKIPAVNPKHIFVAGELSGATLALQFASQEPRIAGCVAMSPFVDMTATLKDLAVPTGRYDLIAQMKESAETFSPLSLTEKIKCPVLITYVRELSDLPRREAEEFVAKLRLTNDSVDFRQTEVVPEDPYYANMKYMNSAAWLRTQVSGKAIYELRPEDSDPSLDYRR